MASCGSNQSRPAPCTTCDDCLQVVKTTKMVRIPCTYNTYKTYTVKVPRQVTKQVPRTTKYTTYETLQKQVPYTGSKSERRTRKETRKYQVPVKRCNIDYVTREKQVEVPYYVNVPETKYRTESYQVPIKKTKTRMETVTKTVYDTKVQRRCVPETRMCSKELPVYNAVAKPCGECSADDILDDSGVTVSDQRTTVPDDNNDTVSPAQQSGSVTGSIGVVSRVIQANGSGDVSTENRTGDVGDEPWKNDDLEYQIMDSDEYNRSLMQGGSQDIKTTYISVDDYNSPTNGNNYTTSNSYGFHIL